MKASFADILFCVKRTKQELLETLEMRGMVFHQLKLAKHDETYRDVFSVSELQEMRQTVVGMDEGIAEMKEHISKHMKAFREYGRVKVWEAFTVPDAGMKVN